METKEITIQCEDGVDLTGTLFKRGNESENGVVIISSAFGITRSFYKQFAKFLSHNNFIVLTFDFRGTGDSKSGIDSRKLRLEDWGRKDIHAAIEYANSITDSNKIYLVGHSVAGQLFCLAQNCETLAGAIIVGAGFPHWTRWTFPRKLLMLFFFNILIPVLGLGRKRFPTRMLGLSNEDLPVNLVHRWGEFSKEKNYVTSRKFGLDIERYRKISIPILSYGFDDDTYSPYKAIKRLHEALPNSKITDEFLVAKRIHPKGVGHFGFFKNNCESSLWPKTLQWLLK